MGGMSFKKGSLFIFPLNAVLSSLLRLSRNNTFRLAGNGAISMQKAGTTGTEESTSSIYSFFFGKVLHLFIYFGIKLVRPDFSVLEKENLHSKWVFFPHENLLNKWFVLYCMKKKPKREFSFDLPNPFYFLIFFSQEMRLLPMIKLQKMKLKV